MTLRTIVPKEGLLAANALVQQAFQIMPNHKPGAGGRDGRVVWSKSRYYLDTATFSFSASIIATLVIARVPVVPSKDSHPLKSVINDLLEGIKFIFTHPTISS